MYIQTRKKNTIFIVFLKGNIQKAKQLFKIKNIWNKKLNRSIRRENWRNLP